MKIEFDPAKSEKNNRERALPFDLAGEFDWESAFYYEDSRADYGETRIIALGCIADRLHVLCFKPIAGGVRIISLRKANTREVRYYEEEILKH
ncbi:MAG: BrnT family toxin [Deltaproteobacteria bacterium]|nr:BrnT family toxin [Deltaproteobacteria bacterium]